VRACVCVCACALLYLCFIRDVRITFIIELEQSVNMSECEIESIALVYIKHLIRVLTKVIFYIILLNYLKFDDACKCINVFNLINLIHN